ncbi:Chitinase 2 [Dispira simplex]|nr:Chitinase 2 [Dispira simplex]
MKSCYTALSVALVCGSALTNVFGFDVNSRSNLATYWGQNSYGVTHPNHSGPEQSLEELCRNNAPSDAFVLAFLHIFNAGTDKPPQMDFAGQCNTTFEGTQLLKCPGIARGIKTCQSKGKAILLSLGGAVGQYSFNNDKEGRAFAHTLWNMFFAGKDSKALRPFGDVVLDGIDLDIEGGSSVGYVAFVSTLRELFAQDKRKRYYISAAPQCPFPDHYMQPILNEAWIDMLFIQFYNNYCGLNDPSKFNFGQWDKWAKEKAVNKDMKIFIGAPGGPKGANSGFVEFSALRSIIESTRAKYPLFGGVMFWDTSQAMNTKEGGSSYAQLTANFLKQA